MYKHSRADHLFQSGTGVFISQANGMFASNDVYDDSKPEHFEAIPHESLHRSVDELVVAADKEGELTC